MGQLRHRRRRQILPTDRRRDRPRRPRLDDRNGQLHRHWHHPHVQEFSAAGTYIIQFGAKGTEAEKFERPQGIAISSAGNLYVADTENNRVEEFKPSGELIRAFGAKGSANGQFSKPYGLAFDPEGKLWVADTKNNRAQRFSSEGAYLSQFGTAGNNNGQLAEPQGLSVDSSGDVWVADTQNNRVQEWFWQVTTYGYDQPGNLTSVQRRAFGKVPAINETYAYDGSGLRASQTVSGAKSYLTWDGTGSLPLLLNDGSANYIYGPGGLPIEQIASEVPTYFHHDQLGSTRMLTNSSGTTTGKFTYAAYGKLTGSSGTQTTPMGFAGQYTNAQSGLQYLRARVYDPMTGQFLSEDPLAILTRSPYSYASDNPPNGVDRSGLCNAEFWTESFWTEGNCLSESPLNPIPYYEKEIEAIEAGCSYWDAVSYGLQGAATLTIDAAGLLAAAEAAPAALSAADYWAEQFATLYPRQYLFIVNQASKIGAGPPIASTATAFFWHWMEEHLRH